MKFAAFFRQATRGENSPYDYQSRLAGDDSGTDCRSQLINIPTGLGKTAAVVLAWLWNRVQLQNPKWPRRLVYCLPMRALVEQTETNAREWLDKSKLADAVSIHVLMGGEEVDRDWDIHPERTAILIGTQDMLLSGALNRGYGMIRYRWPMHFGLLNNDCLWVMDETQLMGVGVETSAQLDGFRHMGTMPTFGACPTWWMSATLDDTRLTTVDHPTPSPDGWPRLELSKEEKEKPGSQPKALFEAQKAVSRCEFALSPTLKSNDYAKQLAALVAKRHLALLEKPLTKGTLTLVVVNRVARAREIYEALTVVDKNSKQPLYDSAKVALIHSRFRPVDRERHTKLLFDEGDRIVIATQAVEAGVDVSARLLITELAPWSSLVQRIGRCNRRADITEAEVLWVDIEPDAKGELLLPYTKDDLEKARSAIGKMADASPLSLGNVDRKDVMEAPIIRPVIRRRDLVDLFDTTPDICGQDLDISRYIRDGDDNDVQLFWRNLEEGKSPKDKEPPPHRDELCRVPIRDAVDFWKRKTTHAWRWNPLEKPSDKKWETAEKPRPGGVYLMDATGGGYDDDLGWTGELKVKKLTTHRSADEEGESYDANRSSFARSWQLIAEHTNLVIKAADALTAALVLDDKYKAMLHTAALWHDVGKAHEEFQKALRDGNHPPPDASAVYAKSENPFIPYNTAKPYRSIRHELASALAWLLKGPADAAERDLIAYIIAAHHGKVRLSIRSLPEEKGDPQDAERLFARGIWHGDKLPAVSLSELSTQEITLDLSFMKMGESKDRGPSWLARTVALRDRIDLGPFRLAYLETLLRAADAQASAKTETAV